MESPPTTSPQSFVDDFVHESPRTHWCPQHLHALWVPHLGSQFRHSLRAHGCSIPDSGFATVQSNPCLREQLLSEAVVHCSGSVGDVRREVHVVQIREEVFLWPQFSRRLFQRVVDRQAEQQWHERVSLFTSFGLDDVMHFPGFICPCITRWVGVGGADERE